MEKLGERGDCRVGRVGRMISKRLVFKVVAPVCVDQGLHYCWPCGASIEQY
jgi:hypothetical protein